MKTITAVLFASLLFASCKKDPLPAGVVKYTDSFSIEATVIITSRYDYTYGATHANGGSWTTSGYNALNTDYSRTFHFYAYAGDSIFFSSSISQSYGNDKIICLISSDYNNIVNDTAYGSLSVGYKFE